MYQGEKEMEEYAELVFKYLMSLCGDADLAEELTQETFYRAKQKVIEEVGKYEV